MLSHSLNKILFIFICLLFFYSSEIQAQSTAICQGDSIVLRMNCSYSGTLQWQYSSDEITWLTIPGATLDTLKVIPTGTTYYRSAIANATCHLVYSDTAIITVNSIPPAPSLSVVDTCGSSRLTAGNYSGTLLWSTGQTINPVTVTIPGNYTITQTVNGCKSVSAGINASPLIAPAAPVAATNSPTTTQIIWNWNNVFGATGYKYNTVNDYSTATNNGNNLSYTQTGLTCNTAYTLYVWAYNSCGNSSVTTLTQTTSSCCAANVGSACDRGHFETQPGCDENYGCAAFWGVYYDNSSGDCNGANSGSFVEYTGSYCTYVGFAYYDPFHYPQPPNGSCFDSSTNGYIGSDNVYTKVVPGTGCTHNAFVHDMIGIVQCDGSCQ